MKLLCVDASIVRFSSVVMWDWVFLVAMSKKSVIHRVRSPLLSCLVCQCGISAARSEELLNGHRTKICILGLGDCECGERTLRARSEPNCPTRSKHFNASGRDDQNK